MKLKLQTSVQTSHIKVLEGFDESLFARLAPPFPPVKVLRFDGCKTGDLVELELNFLLFSQKWTSKITKTFSNEGECGFVDEGVRLPFFLGSWKHTHRIIATSEGSIISDEIEFQGKYPGLSPILFPLLWLQFWYRKPIYRKWFKLK